MKKRVAFIFFDDLHHIQHFVGIASELSKNDNYQVDVITYPGEHVYLKSLIQLLGGNKIKLVKVFTRKVRQLIDKVKGRKRPSPLFLTKHNRKLMSSYDALVFTDFKTNYFSKKNNTKFIYINHGSGDGAYGYKTDNLETFDLLLLAGEKIIERAYAEGMKEVNYKIIGYSKFDVTMAEYEEPKLFENNNKTVLYNPHNKVDLSSWYKHGIEVLEFFYKHKEYNLIFAPHINLFNHKYYLSPEILDKKYFDAENIHMDTGSNNSSNMTYTLSADIYLGDVSSQIYEFLHTRKPCLFLNAHKVDWIENPSYLHWNFGKVLSETTRLGDELQTAIATHRDYVEVQNKLFNKTFDINPEVSSSKRGALEIAKYLDTILT